VRNSPATQCSYSPTPLYFCKGQGLRPLPLPLTMALWAIGHGFGWSSHTAAVLLPESTTISHQLRRLPFKRPKHHNMNLATWHRASESSTQLYSVCGDSTVCALPTHSVVAGISTAASFRTVHISCIMA